jgi:P-type conjugative transfer protein TrbJ
MLNVRSTHARRTASALVVLLLVAGAARPAHAIFGVGDIVYDPANHSNAMLRYAQLILQGRQMAQQIRVATSEANHIIHQARGFSVSRLRLPSIGTVLSEIDRRYGRGESLGYGNSRLDEIFRTTFPAVADWNRQAAGRQAEAARQLAYGALMGTRDNFLLLARSQQRFDQLKAELATASTDRQVAQIQNRIAAEQLDRQLQEQRLQMGVANMQAVDLALRADRSAREAMEDTARATLESYQQGVHEAAARRVRAREESIARERARRGVSP